MPNEMNDGNYGGGPPDEDIAEGPETTDDSEVVGASALLPKNMLSEGAKVGDTITIRIDALFDSEAEVSVVSETETPETEMIPMSADDEIDAAGAGMA